MGWEDACTLEETGEFQAGAAKRYTSQRGDRPRAEGRGQKTGEFKGYADEIWEIREQVYQTLYDRLNF